MITLSCGKIQYKSLWSISAGWGLYDCITKDETARTFHLRRLSDLAELRSMGVNRRSAVFNESGAKPYASEARDKVAVPLLGDLHIDLAEVFAL